MRALASERQRELLDAADRQGRLARRHGGGLGHLRQVVEDWITAPDASQAGRERRRSWVLFDRDVHPRDLSRPHANSQQVQELLDNQDASDDTRVIGHQLGRRSIENHLPNRALRVWVRRGSGVDRKRRQEALDALVAVRQQRPQVAWWLSMKEGLRKDLAQDARRTLARQLQGNQQGTRTERTRLLPYALAELVPVEALPEPIRTLNKEQRAALALGFGADIARQYKASVTTTYLRSEYARGPNEVPTPDELIESLLHRI